MSRYGIAGFDTWLMHNPLDDIPDPSEEMYFEAEAELIAEGHERPSGAMSTRWEKLVDERARLIHDRYIQKSRDEARENASE